MSSITIDQFNGWLLQPEDERFEFKEAKHQFDFERLVRLASAMANEGGGYLIFGVTDTLPRRVVGSKAFPHIEHTCSELIQRLQIRISGQRLQHPDGNVTILQIPSRPLGVPLQYKGMYLMRAGEDTVSMTPDRLRAIFDEAVPDFSAQVCQAATLADLDRRAISLFREAMLRKSRLSSRAGASDNQLLEDAELIVDGGVTWAALVLLGTKRAVGRYLAQAEIVFEYRNSEASIPSQQREEFREGFLLIHDDLWQLINLRNDVFQFQEGFIRRDIPTFAEPVIREAILNAISHRDYQKPGSIYIRQYPTRLEIESPGGFPAGVTPETILWKTVPRNRRVAEALTVCGLVERSGQGADLMFETSIREGKLPPDYSGTDDYQVVLNLNGEVRDPRFLRFLEEISKETQEPFMTEDLLVLDCIHRDEPLPDVLRARVPRLRELGIIETLGRGRGFRYILSRRFYRFVGQGGRYTSKLGLDRETNKMLLLRHIEDNATTGTQMGELTQVLPTLVPKNVQRLVYELRDEQRIHMTGRTSTARWYPGPPPDTSNRSSFKG